MVHTREGAKGRGEGRAALAGRNSEPHWWVKPLPAPDVHMSWRVSYSSGPPWTLKTNHRKDPTPCLTQTLPLPGLVGFWQTIQWPVIADLLLPSCPSGARHQFSAVLAPLCTNFITVTDKRCWASSVRTWNPPHELYPPTLHGSQD